MGDAIELQSDVMDVEALIFGANSAQSGIYERFVCPLNRIHIGLHYNVT